jgi:hypothetical protein
MSTIDHGHSIGSSGFCFSRTRMSGDVQEVTLEPWDEPPAMETGAPEPFLIRDGATVWVAYHAQDPAFPGWNHAEVTDYLEARAGQAFGVVRFDGVADCSMGPPNDERLHQHPLYGRGLRFYSFHHVRPSAAISRWIVTFHEETLEVRAQSATAAPVIFASSPGEAITKAKIAG